MKTVGYGANRSAYCEDVCEESETVKMEVREQTGKRVFVPAYAWQIYPNGVTKPIGKWKTKLYNRIFLDPPRGAHSIFNQLQHIVAVVHSR